MNLAEIECTALDSDIMKEVVEIVRYEKLATELAD